MDYCRRCLFGDRVLLLDVFFFFSSRRRHTRLQGDWSSDVCSSDLETKFIDRAVRQYGTDHQELDLTPAQDLCGAIEEFAYYSDEPSADAGSLPVWFLSKLCKSKTTVALSGEGADELFGGYITCPADLLA